MEPTRLLADMFWNRVLIPHGATDGDCWEWIGGKSDSGYGILLSGLPSQRRPVRAHRLAWELHYGPIPPGLCVCHTCDCPGCVNPSHLFIGSHADNMADMKAKGRGRSSTGEASPRAKLKQIDVDRIRALFSSGLRIYEIARIEGLRDSYVHKIVKRRTWPAPGDPPSLRKGKPPVLLKITEQDAATMREARANGVAVDVLSARFGVCRSSVYRVTSRAV